MTTIAISQPQAPQVASRAVNTVPSAELDPVPGAFSELVEQHRTTQPSSALGTGTETPAIKAKAAGENPGHDAGPLDAVLDPRFDPNTPAPPFPDAISMLDAMSLGSITTATESLGAMKPPSPRLEDEAAAEETALPAMFGATPGTPVPTMPASVTNAVEGETVDSAAAIAEWPRAGIDGFQGRIFDAHSEASTEALVNLQNRAAFKIFHSETHMVALPRAAQILVGATESAFKSDFASAIAAGDDIAPAHADPAVTSARSDIAHSAASPASPHAQIAASIISLLEPEEASSMTTLVPHASGKPEHVTPEAATTAKSIQLRLHPESLGQVDVRLKMVGTSVHVQLRLESQEALELVRAGRTDLAHILATAGITMDSMAVGLQRQLEAPSLMQEPGHKYSPASTGSNDGPESQARNDNQRRRHEPRPPDPSHETERPAAASHVDASSTRRFVYV